MDIVGMIKKSYRGYGSLFSDKFRETFLKGDNKLVRELKFLIFCCCFCMTRILIDFSLQLWVSIVVVVITTIILLSIHLWRKNKIRSEFSA